MSTCNAHRRGPIKTLIEDMTSWEAGWVRGTARGMERQSLLKLTRMRILHHQPVPKKTSWRQRSRAVVVVKDAQQDTRWHWLAGGPGGPGGPGVPCRWPDVTPRACTHRAGS